MTIPTYLVDFIKQYEGLRLSAYYDSVGVLTIGYGHTGRDVHINEVITLEEANNLLTQDITLFWNSISRNCKVELTEYQQSALTSFAFNLGMTNLLSSTLWKLLNEEDYDGASKQFTRWVYAGGKILPGLVKRRAAEKNMFLGNV